MPNLGSIAGTGLSLVIGAVVIQLLAQHPLIAVTGIRADAYWHLVFPVVGLTGLLIAWASPAVAGEGTPL